MRIVSKGINILKLYQEAKKINGFDITELIALFETNGNEKHSFVTVQDGMILIKEKATKKSTLFKCVKEHFKINIPTHTPLTDCAYIMSETLQFTGGNTPNCKQCWKRALETYSNGKIDKK